MITHHDLGIPCHGYKDGIDTRAKRCCVNVADLQADQEGKGNNNNGILALGIIGRISELEIKVGQECSYIAYQHGAGGKHRPYQTFVDKGIDAAALDQSVHICQ